MKIIVVFAAVVASACAVQDGLRTTFGLNFFDSWNFAVQPKTEAEAIANGWTQRDSYCGADTTFRGVRYWKDQDPALTLIYDRPNGYIAGIQTSAPKNVYTPKTNPAQWVDDGNYWTLTAYVYKPSSICGSGRTSAQYQSKPIGGYLELQNSSNALQNGVVIPTTQSGIQGTQWTKGRCFWAMGQHYWWNLSKDMKAENYLDMFILYHNDDLHGFGFTIDAVLPSKRYEKPNPTSAKFTMQDVPDFIANEPSSHTSSSLHVYFSDSPRSVIC